MKCYYIIKDPSGGNDIKIPAGFELMVPTGAVTNTIESLKQFSGTDLSEEDKEKKDNVINTLRNVLRILTPTPVKDRTLNRIIDENIDNPDNIIPELNKIIQNLGEFNGFYSAIIDYIKENKGQLNKLIGKLDKPITIKYFQGLTMEGILGSTNLKTEKNKLKARIMENLDFGFSNVIPENVNKFINAVLYRGGNYKQLLEANVLLQTTNLFGARALNIGEHTFFNDNDDLSLFMGLFKRVAKDVDKQSLYNILIDFNKAVKFKKYGKLSLGSVEEFSVEGFFNGVIDDKGNYNIGGFDELISATNLELVKDTQIVKDTLDSIIKLVSNHLKEGDKELLKTIRTLFWSMDPDKYGSTAFKEELLQEKFLNAEIKTDRQYKDRLRLKFLEKTSSNRDLYYAEQEEIESDLFNNAVLNITPNQDLVLVPDGKISRWILVTGIYPRASGVAIYGIYRNENGEASGLNTYFKENTDTIQYRKQEDSKNPVNKNEVVTRNEDFIVVDLKGSKNVPQGLLKRLLEKGDTINKNQLVVGVYSGGIKTEKGTYLTSYKKIKSLTSKQAKMDLETVAGIQNDLKKFVQISDSSLLSEGDLFFDKKAGFYKRVLYADKENLYSWVQKEGQAAIIVGTPRTEVTNGLAHTYDELNESELRFILEQNNLIGKSSASVSFFINPHIARNGDYFIVGEDTDKMRIGKVVDYKNKKGVVHDANTGLNPEPINYSKETVRFLTTRDISSQYAIQIARVNDWKIHLIDEETASQDPKYEKVRFVVPVGTNLKELILLPSYYADIGKYKDFNVELAPGEQDVTSEILRLLQEDGKDTTGLSLYAEKENGKGDNIHYARNLYLLHRINNFDTLSSEVKRELDVLKPGTYFQVYTSEKSIGPNIYRIISYTDDTVTAHLNKISQKTGKMLTVEQEFKKEDLLQTKTLGSIHSPVGSIAALYLLYGNNNFNVVTQSINEKLGVEEVATQKTTNKLIGEMKNTFKKIGVKVEVVPAERAEFLPGQHAKIETGTENGKTFTTIFINKNSFEPSDLVHETLHVYLTLLRYVDLETYNKFLDSVLGDKLREETVTAREEVFVKKVSDSVSTEVDFLKDNVRDFTESLLKAILTINPSFEFNMDEVLDSPLTLLKSSLVEVFGVTLENTHPMYNLSMITTEPIMREWMTKRKITLKC